MIIRPSLPSHGPVSASSRVHTCVSRRPIPTLLLFLRDARLSFSPSLPLRALPRLRKIVYGWKLEVPRCPAAVRGVSWQKCNAAYHKICPRWSPRKKDEREGTVCTLYTNVQCGLEVLAKRLTMVAMKRFQREEL